MMSEMERLLQHRPANYNHEIYRGAAMSDETKEQRTRAFWSVTAPWPKLKQLPRKVVDTLYVIPVDKGSWDKIIVNYPDDCETYYEK